MPLSTGQNHSSRKPSSKWTSVKYITIGGTHPVGLLIPRRTFHFANHIQQHHEHVYVEGSAPPKSQNLRGPSKGIFPRVKLMLNSIFRTFSCCSYLSQTSVIKTRLGRIFKRKMFVSCTNRSRLRTRFLEDINFI